ncbi:hypothetical protein ACFXTH_010981 [Malus domestica]
MLLLYHPPHDPTLCPKLAAEEVGKFLHNSRVPELMAEAMSVRRQYSYGTLEKKNSGSENGCILASDVDSVILPIDAFGGHGALSLARSKRNKPLIIAVEENATVLDDTPDKFGIEAVKVSNYWEAIGVMAAHKAGLNPHSLRRNKIKNLQRTLSPANGYAIKKATAIGQSK